MFETSLLVHLGLILLVLILAVVYICKAHNKAQKEKIRRILGGYDEKALMPISFNRKNLDEKQIAYQHTISNIQGQVVDHSYNNVIQTYSSPSSVQLKREEMPAHTCGSEFYNTSSSSHTDSVSSGSSGCSGSYD